MKMAHEFVKKQLIDNINSFKNDTFQSHRLQVALIEFRSAKEEKRKYLMVS